MRRSSAPALAALPGLAGTLSAGYLQRHAAARSQRQAWRAEVYVSALTALNRERMIVARTFPIIGPGPAPPAPNSDEVAELVQATLSAHSSKAMRALLDRWMEAGARFNALTWELLEADRSVKTEHISFREATGGRTRSEVWRDCRRCAPRAHRQAAHSEHPERHRDSGSQGTRAQGLMRGGLCRED